MTEGERWATGGWGWAALAAAGALGYVLAWQLGPVAALLSLFHPAPGTWVDYFWKDRENLYLPAHGVRVALFLYPAAAGAAFFCSPGVAALKLGPLANWARGKGRYLGLYLAGLALLVAVAWFVMGAEPHEFDETAYILQGKIFAHGRLWAEKPPTDAYYADEGGELNNFFVGLSRLEALRGRKWFTIYAPLHPAFLAVGYLIRAPWLINPLLAAAVPPLLVALARHAAPRAAPWTAVLAVSSPFWLFNGASFMSEGTWLPLFTLFLLLYFRAREKESKGGYLAAGAVLGLAALNREWTTFISAFPVLGHATWATLKGRRAAPALWVALGAAPAVALYYAYNVVLSGDPLKLVRSYSRQEHFGFNEVHTVSAALNWAVRNLYVMSSDFFGWPLVCLVPPAVYLVKKRPLPLFAKIFYATFASNFIGNFFIQNAGIIYGPRYYAGVYPGAVVVTAALGAEIADGGATRFLGRAFSPRGWCGALLASLVIINAAFYFPYGVRKHHGFPFKYQPWATAELKRALAAADVHHAVVFVAPRERYRGPMPNDPTFNDDVIYARHQFWRNREVMAFLPGRRYLVCDYEVFERDGLLSEITPAGAAGPGGP